MVDLLRRNPSDNPIASRLWVDRWWLSRIASPRMTVAFAATMGLALTVFFFLALRFRTTSGVFYQDPLFVSLYSIMSFGWAVMLGTPIALARRATVIVLTTVQEDSYQLVRATPLSSADRLWGFIVGTIYQTRLSWALVFGMLPAAAVGTVVIGVWLDLLAYSSNGVLSQPLNISHYVLRCAGYTAVTLGLLLLSLGGICVGIAQGLRGKSEIGAGLTAAGLMALVVLLCGFAILQMPPGVSSAVVFSMALAVCIGSLQFAYDKV